jgi:hypothetical protein
MQSELRKIENDFEALAARLAALMNHYAEDPTSADAQESVGRAFGKATEALALLRMYRTGQS